MPGPEGNKTAWNSEAERIYGYSEADALPMNIFQFVLGDKQRETPIFFDRIKKGESIDSFETQRLTRLGKTGYLFDGDSSF